MTDLRQLLGKNIKIYRKSCNISQSKLAENVDTATNYISAIEAGRRFPSVKMLEKIAAALGIDIIELFSVKPIQFEREKKELEEQIWQDIGQNLSWYISKKLTDIQSKTAHRTKSTK
ncbi:MAG: helix-turn-helix domain-containing protein [Treponema sp.]|nr:helix-turn-helix domain-containing protein [Treponema sp.]